MDQGVALTRIGAIMRVSTRRLRPMINASHNYTTRTHRPHFFHGMPCPLNTKLWKTPKLQTWFGAATGLPPTQENAIFVIRHYALDFSRVGDGVNLNSVVFDARKRSHWNTLCGVLWSALKPYNG